MTWNYRVCKQRYPLHTSSLPDDDIEQQYTYAIFEVYYDENGEAEYVTTKPVYPQGEDYEDLQMDMTSYWGALDKPVLNWDDIGRELK